MNKLKWIILPVLMIVSFVLITKPINGAMTPNIDYPPNQASNSWSQPVLTYNGQYVISLNGPSGTNSKSIAVSIPMQDVLYFTFTYYDENMNVRTISSQNNGFNRYYNVLIDSMGNSHDIYMQSLEFEVSTWKLEVYTIFNFTAGGGNTGTWRTNIMTFAYISQSPLYGQLNSLSENIYTSAYNKGYEDGENDGYLSGIDYGYDLGYDDGYDVGLSNGSEVMSNVQKLFEGVLSTIGNVFSTTIFPGVTIGTLFMIPISFAMFKWFLRLIR